MSGHRYHLPPIGRQTLDSKWKLNLSKSVISYSSILIVKIWLMNTDADFLFCGEPSRIGLWMDVRL